MAGGTLYDYIHCVLVGWLAQWWFVQILYLSVIHVGWEDRWHCVLHCESI